MNIQRIIEEKNCTGCMTCLNVCPVNAIQQGTDSEGFAIPTIEDSCINCGKCMTKCPIDNSNSIKHNIEESECYIGQSLSRKQVKKSASGGVFYEIARYTISQLNGIVCGAAFDENNVVRHICVDNIRDLTKLQNSKYVQSFLDETYNTIKNYLDNNRYVFFTGTPCQVAGIKRYLGGGDDKLITADIICHGVPSPKLLQKEVLAESKSWQGRVKRVSFRYKRRLYNSTSSFYMMMTMMRGLPIVRKPQNDPYYNIFSKGIGFRESCYRCKFAAPDRVGDFTIGDCDSHSLYPNFHPEESNSTILLNTDKARHIWKAGVSQCFDFQPLDIKKEIEYNEQLGKPAARPLLRDEVYKDLESLNWLDFSSKYSERQTIKQKIRSYCVVVVPPFIIKLWRNKNG